MDKDVIAQNNTPIIAEPTGIVPADGSSGKVLQLSSDSSRPQDYGRMLAAVAQMLNAADVLAKIQKGVEYVVQVPAQYQAALQKGAVAMLKRRESDEYGDRLLFKAPRKHKKIAGRHRGSQ